MSVAEGIVGAPAAAGEGMQDALRLSRMGALVGTDAHGRYYEAIARGNVYHAATAAAGITCAAANASPLAAGTGQPIVGLFNPPNSGKNALVLFLDLTHVSGTVVAGGFLWNFGTPNQAITAALTVPTNLLTYQQTGSVMKASVNQALTGSTVALAGPLVPFVTPFAGAVAATTVNMGGRYEYAGAILVPQGGYAGIATAASSTEVAAAGLTWEEVPV